MKSEKLCNAFVPESAVRDMDLGPFGTSIDEEIDRFKKKHGGLWVGGIRIVADGRMTFNKV